MKRFLLVNFLMAAGFAAVAQMLPSRYTVLKPDVKVEPVYKYKAAVDIPVTAAATGFTIYGFSQIYSKDNSALAEVLALNKDDLNGFDRWAAGLNSESASNTSDILFYGAIPLPLVLLADKNIRGDGLKVMALYVQAMSLTGVLYTGVPMLIDRYRPLMYNKEVPTEELLSGNNRNSFFAGHVALVGTSTFFIAKVFNDHHPNSKLKPYFWAGAGVATAATAYLRHRAGKHFPSDIVVGTAVGVLSGVLVPHLHKIKTFKNQNISVMPFSGRSHGLVAVYRFK